MHIYECTVYTSCICTTLNTRCWLKSVQCHNQARPAQIPAGGDHQLMSLVLFQGSCVIIIAERSRLVGSTQREVTTRRLLRSLLLLLLQRYCCTLHAASRNRENIYYLFCEHASISDIHTHHQHSTIASNRIKMLEAFRPAPVRAGFLACHSADEPNTALDFDGRTPPGETDF